MQNNAKSSTNIKKYVLVVVLGVFIGIIPMISHKETQNFEIFHSFKIVSGDYVDTSINVIVTAQEYETEIMFTKIKEFHNALSGEPDKLTIHLYNSKEDLENHNCIDTKIYYKERR